MVTYDAMDMLFQFGISLVTTFTAVVTVIMVVNNKKKK
ncbi:putative holin-like toxin [Oceanobacillus damuensis]|nr:putative holin-like toxin [Oceanobacillus damuensis]